MREQGAAPDAGCSPCPGAFRNTVGKQQRHYCPPAWCAQRDAASRQQGCQTRCPGLESRKRNPPTGWTAAKWFSARFRRHVCARVPSGERLRRTKQSCAHLCLGIWALLDETAVCRQGLACRLASKHVAVLQHKHEQGFERGNERGLTSTQAQHSSQSTRHLPCPSELLDCLQPA